MRELLELMDTQLTAYVNNASEQTESRRLAPEETAILNEISTRILPEIRQAVSSGTVSAETYTGFATRIFNLSQTQREIKHFFSAPTYEDNLDLARNLRPLYRDFQRQYLYLRGINTSKAPAAAAVPGPSSEATSQLALMREEIETFKRAQEAAAAETERKRAEELATLKAAAAEAERKRAEELATLKRDQEAAAAEAARQTQAAIDRLTEDNKAKDGQLALVAQTAEKRALALAQAEEGQLMLRQQGGDIVRTLLTQLARSGGINPDDPTAQAAIQLFNVKVEFNQAHAAAGPANTFEPLPYEFHCSKSLENKDGLIETQSNREYSRRMLYSVTSDLRFLAIEMLVKYFDYVLMAMHFQNPDMFTGTALADVQERIKYYTVDKNKFNNTYPLKSVDDLKREVAPFTEELAGSSKEELTELIKRLCFYIFRETEKTWAEMSNDEANPVRAILADITAKHSGLKQTIIGLANLGKRFSDSMGRPESLAAKLDQTKDEQLTDPQKVHKVAGLYQGTLFACQDEDRDVIRAYMPQDDALATEGQERFDAAKPMSPTALYALRPAR